MKYIVNLDQEKFTVEIENLNSRPIVAFVDGTRFEVWPESDVAVQALPTAQTTQLPAQTQAATPPPVSRGIPSGASLNIQLVRAPIPGVIIDILVKPDDQVEAGQGLFTIEAMKMRNAIRSPRSGKIKEVFVTVGQTVNHNDRLLEFAE